MSWVIYKSSRSPANVSYNGPSWDDAQLRHRRLDVYESKDEALELARRGKMGPAGWSGNLYPDLMSECKLDYARR